MAANANVTVLILRFLFVETVRNKILYHLAVAGHWATADRLSCAAADYDSGSAEPPICLGGGGPAFGTAMAGERRRGYCI